MIKIPVVDYANRSAEYSEIKKAQCRANLGNDGNPVERQILSVS
jgi:hypothetical protein